MSTTAKRYGIKGVGVSHGKRVWITNRGDWMEDAKQARTWATERAAAVALERLRLRGESLPTDRVAAVPR